MTETQSTATNVREQYTVTGNQVVQKVKELVAQGNVRSVVVKHNGRKVVEFPLTVGVVGTLLAPQVMLLGALAAMLAQCSIEVVRRDTVGD